MSWTRLDCSLRKPTSNRRRVEAQQRAPLDVGDPSLRDKPSDVSHADPEVLGHVRDVHQARYLIGLCRSSGVAGGDTQRSGGHGLELATAA